jgi:plastocyanin
MPAPHSSRSLVGATLGITLALAMLNGCSSSDVAVPADGGPVVGATVTVGPGGSTSFLPVTVTVKKGQAVTWTWDEGAHSVTSGAGCKGDGTFDSGQKTAPFSFTQVFDTAGSFPYFCTPHCAAGMAGTVVVTP